MIFVASKPFITGISDSTVFSVVSGPKPGNVLSCEIIADLMVISGKIILDIE